MKTWLKNPQNSPNNHIKATYLCLVLHLQLNQTYNQQKKNENLRGKSGGFHPLSIKKLKTLSSYFHIEIIFSALICGYFCYSHFRHSWFFDFTSSTGCYGCYIRSVVIYKSGYTTLIINFYQNLKWKVMVLHTLMYTCLPNPTWILYSWLDHIRIPTRRQNYRKTFV